MPNLISFTRHDSVPSILVIFLYFIGIASHIDFAHKKGQFYVFLERTRSPPPPLREKYVKTILSIFLCFSLLSRLQVNGKYSPCTKSHVWFLLLYKQYKFCEKQKELELTDEFSKENRSFYIPFQDVSKKSSTFFNKNIRIFSTTSQREKPKT